MRPSPPINGDIPFVVYFSLSDDKSDVEITEHIEEYMACGKRLFTLSSDLMQELIDHEERVKTIKNIYDQHGALCRCAHSTWGEGNELSLPFDGNRKRMLRLAERQLELAALFGADTCAFHAENWSNDTFRPRTLEQWRSYIDDSLEKLLPVAERCNVVIALENIWSHIAAPEELCGFVERFHSPYLGLCFDIGHANVLAASGTRSCSWMPWTNKEFDSIPWDDHILDKMLPHIVTAHLHDNATDTDSHDIPGKGNIDWETNMAKLMRAPRLRTLQHEIAQSFHYPAQTILDAFSAKGIY